MLVGTYWSCYHARHSQHSSGACNLPDCNQFPGDLFHIFKSCSFLKPIIKYLPIAKQALASYPFLRTLFSRMLACNTPLSLQFLLDPSTDPAVVAFPPLLKKVAIPLLFEVSRILIWPVHWARLRALGLSRYL